MSTIKPILFNTEMTLAVLKNRKSQTRRLVTPTPPTDARLVMTPDKRNGWDESRELPGLGPDDRRVYYPRYYPGDILYVRETWSTKLSNECYAQPCHTGRCPYESCESAPGPCFPEEYIYKATDNLPSYGGKWHPSIHMPKEAARIFLRVTDVRVERLQEITDEGAEHEGICGYYVGMGESAYSRYSNWNEAKNHLYDFPRGAFADLWTHTLKPTDIGKYGWAANPWVWVYCFERCEKPEDWA